MASRWPPALSSTAFNEGQLISVKISEDRSLSQNEREQLLPIIACMDNTDLSDALVWSKDKLNLFDKLTKFKPYEYEAGMKFETAYYQPDAETTYCAVTTGDTGVLYCYVEDSGWKIFGIFSIVDGSRNHMHKFVSYEELSAKESEGIMSPKSESASLTNSEDNYWSQYDNLPSDPDAEPDNVRPLSQQKPGSTKDYSRVFLRSHVLSVLRDLHEFYTDLGFESEKWCRIVLSWLNEGGGRTENPVERLNHRILSSLARLHEQMLISKSEFERDVQLAIVELHPFALSDHESRDSYS